ncbi:dihydroxyacetone kinase [Microbacterium phyllosphaerae]|nr:dihydroxyacetone kinase [Microbacterium phyllosphaerae]
MAARLGDQKRPDDAAVASGVADGVQGVQTYGKAEVGDKTMVDALVPFTSALSGAIDGGSCLADAWETAADAATGAAAATADLLPKMGRARTHGEHSLGTPDPGAISFALIVTALNALLDPKDNS